MARAIDDHEVAIHQHVHVNTYIALMFMLVTPRWNDNVTVA